MDQGPDPIDHRLRTPRAAAVAGILFSVLLAASLGLIRVSIPADPRGPAADVIAHARTVAFALNLIPFAGIAFLWFIAVVRDRLGGREDRFFVTVFLGSGYLFVATIFVSAVLAGSLLVALDIAADELIRSGAYALARAAVYQAASVYAVKMAAVFMFTCSTVGLRTAIFPRWVAFLGYGLGAALVASVGTVEWAPVVFPLWVLVVSVSILVDTLRERPAAGGRDRLP